MQCFAVKYTVFEMTEKTHFIYVLNKFENCLASEKLYEVQKCFQGHSCKRYVVWVGTNP